MDVCESPECVADRCIGLESDAGVQNRVWLYWHRNPESLRVSRNCQRTVEWIVEGLCLCVRVYVGVRMYMHVYMTVCDSL